jgi:hypothetical protein
LGGQDPTSCKEVSHDHSRACRKVARKTDLGERQGNEKGDSSRIAQRSFLIERKALKGHRRIADPQRIKRHAQCDFEPREPTAKRTPMTLEIKKRHDRFVRDVVFHESLLPSLRSAVPRCERGNRNSYGVTKTRPRDNDQTLRRLPNHTSHNHSEPDLYNLGLHPG